MPLTDIQKVSQSVSKAHHKLDRITSNVQSLGGKFPQIFKDHEKFSASLDDLTRTTESTHQFQATVEFVDAINESLDGILSAIKASERGDTFGIATHSLGSAATIIKGYSSLTLMLGPEMLPVAVIGFILGSIIDGVARIVEYFAPEEESLLEKIEKLLRKTEAENRFHALRAAFEEIVKLEGTFETPGGDWERASWAEYSSKMDATLGDARHHLGEVASWLEKRENQELLEDWTSVLEVYVYCHASLHLLLLRTYFRAQQRALETRDDLRSTKMTAATFDAVKALVAAQLTAVSECRDHYQALLGHLDNLAWPARNVARLYSLGADEQLYSTDGCIVERRESGWTCHGGEHHDFTFVDAKEHPTVLAWHADGGDAEILKRSEWKKVDGISAGHRSVDVVAVGDGLVCVASDEDERGVTIHATRMTSRGHQAKEAAASIHVPSRFRISGAVRGFVVPGEDGEDVVQVAFLVEGGKVYATRGPKALGALGQVGKRIDWCQQVFARDGKVWAIGAHKVAWLPYAAADTADWHDVSPRERKVGLDGRWDFIYLDPPGADGMMVGTLVHQLLFWTKETGWRKGKENESDIAFTAARHAPHPICVEMLALRGSVRETLDLMEGEAVKEVMSMLPETVPLEPLTPARAREW